MTWKAGGRGTTVLIPWTGRTTAAGVVYNPLERAISLGHLHAAYSVGGVP
jgi:hypothetical protein